VEGFMRNIETRNAIRSLDKDIAAFAKSVGWAVKGEVNKNKYLTFDMDACRDEIASLRSRVADISKADPVHEVLAGHFSDFIDQAEQNLSRPQKSDVVRADDEVVKVTEEEYRNQLKNYIGVDLDEILSWYESENEKTRAEALEIANRLHSPVKSTAEVNELLFKYAGPCDNATEMLMRANDYLVRTRKGAKEHIWLPEDEKCECVAVDVKYKDSYPWGGYSSDKPLHYPLYNTMFLNIYNYKNVTDGWIKINALHEAYPGHHAQYVRCMADPIPETLKRGAKSVTFSEGVCIRTERVFEHVFAEDPYYPLMVAQRRHHTSTRIKVDLWLFYFGKTIGECVELYMKEMGFDRKTARAQVQAHENVMGYFTSYYFGMKKLEDWERENGWEQKAYTEELFSNGRMALETFERILKLTPEERYSLQHDYASLVQFK